MERIVHKSTGFEEAEEWDIEQQIKMTPQQRQDIAKQLREKYYGTDVPDVRDREAQAQ